MSVQGIGCCKHIIGFVVADVRTLICSIIGHLTSWSVYIYIVGHLTSPLVCIIIYSCYIVGHLTSVHLSVYRGGWSRLIIRSRALYVCTQGPQPSPTQLSAFHSLEVSFVF